MIIPARLSASGGRESDRPRAAAPAQGDPRPGAELTYPVGKDTSVAPELLIPFGQIAAIADGAPAEYDTGLHYWLPPG